jgi:hypothetical protein
VVKTARLESQGSGTRQSTALDNGLPLRERALPESLDHGQDFPFVTPKVAPRGAIFDTFLICLGIALNMYVNERRVTAVRSGNKPLEKSSAPYRITRDLLSIQFNAPANPRLMMIPAQSGVELKGTSSGLRFAETHLGTPESH